MITYQTQLNILLYLLLSNEALEYKDNTFLPTFDDFVTFSLAPLAFFVVAHSSGQLHIPRARGVWSSARANSIAEVKDANKKKNNEEDEEALQAKWLHHLLVPSHCR